MDGNVTNLMEQEKQHYILVSSFSYLASSWCPYYIIISCTLLLFLLVSKRDKSRQNMLQWILWKYIIMKTNDGDDLFSGNCEL